MFNLKNEFCDYLKSWSFLTLQEQQHLSNAPKLAGRWTSKLPLSIINPTGKLKRSVHDLFSSVGVTSVIADYLFLEPPAYCTCKCSDTLDVFSQVYYKKESKSSDALAHDDSKIINMSGLQEPGKEVKVGDLGFEYSVSSREVLRIFSVVWIHPSNLIVGVIYPYPINIDDADEELLFQVHLLYVPKRESEGEIDLEDDPADYRYDPSPISPMTKIKFLERVSDGLDKFTFWPVPQLKESCLSVSREHYIHLDSWWWATSQGE